MNRIFRYAYAFWLALWLPVVASVAPPVFGQGCLTLLGILTCLIGLICVARPAAFASEVCRLQDWTLKIPAYGPVQQTFYSLALNPTSVRLTGLMYLAAGGLMVYFAWGFFGEAITALRAR